MQDIHFIASKLESGMTEAVNFLVKKKHRNIALINGPEILPACRERYDAYINALRKNKIKVDESRIISSDLTIDGNIEAMKKILSLPKRPTAVIAFNDYVAMDAIHYARRQ